MRITLFILIAVLSSCKLKLEEGTNITSGSFIVGANCHLVMLAQDALCVEYRRGSFTELQVDSDCDAQDVRYTAMNHSTHFYTYNIVTTCRSGGKVGLCALTNKQIFYYSNDWTSLTAESDCTSLTGRFTAL